MNSSHLQHTVAAVERHVAIVTGAADGIGLAIARLFAKKGLAVVLGDINQERGRLAETAIRTEGGVAVFQPADVRDEKSVQSLIDRGLQEYGRIDALCNNAGIERYKLADEYSLDDWHAIVDTNLRGTFLCNKYAIPHLRQTKGTIVNIASVQAFASEPKISIYAATKAGILALTRGAALDCAHDGIRVNAICPGAIHTTMLDKSLPSGLQGQAGLEAVSQLIPLGRVGRPEDIANMAYFLISAEASYITGACFVVDGGLLAKLAL